MDSLSDTDLSDYDVISNSGLDSSSADVSLAAAAARPPVFEPPPAPPAIERFRDAIGLGAEDIQAGVLKFLGRTRREERTMRVYVDGLFDGFTVGHAHQLRQAKLSFPSVHLLVGVFSDALCRSHDAATSLPHADRCEIVRHCRWVDEVVSDAPWQVDERLLRARKIDFVAVEEGITVDPNCHMARVRGYDELKRIGRIIQTRRTHGVARPLPPAPTPVPAPAVLRADSYTGTIRASKGPTPVPTPPPEPVLKPETEELPNVEDLTIAPPLPESPPPFRTTKRHVLDAAPTPTPEPHPELDPFVN